MPPGRAEALPCFGAGDTAASICPNRSARLVGHRYLSNHSMETILTDYTEDNNKQETRELTAA